MMMKINSQSKENQKQFNLIFHIIKIINNNSKRKYKKYWSLIKLIRREFEFRVNIINIKQKNYWIECIKQSIILIQSKYAGNLIKPKRFV